MGKDMGYEIPTRQMQNDAVDKETDQKLNGEYSITLERTVFKMSTTPNT